jgi:hypothetical protein
MFLKLTASDGDAIFIRSDSIVFMYRKSENLTHIQINKNTEQILEMIKNA